MSERNHKPWEIVGRTPLFTGGPIAEVASETVRLPDGREIPDYYRITLRDYALIFAVTREDDVLLLKQYKHGPRRTCITCPGGAIDSGETPLDAARRELREETGYVSDQWRHVGGFTTNANQGCNTAHLFIAKDCRQEGEPTQPDMEAPELLFVHRSAFWSTVVPSDVALASHLALMALATNPDYAIKR